MGNPTANYGFDKPTVGGDEDNWGDDYSTGDPLVDPSPGLNGNWEKADQLIKQLSDQVTDLVDNIIPELQQRAQIQIGELYTSVTDDDPATNLGYGTWVPWGEGRAIVGAGDNTESVWAVGDERGAETHTLVSDELPAHDHGSGTLATASAGAHTHTYQGTAVGSVGGFDGGTDRFNQQQNTGSAGAHTHNITGRTGSIGADTPHNNLQPSKAVYIWERTA